VKPQLLLAVPAPVPVPTVPVPVPTVPVPVAQRCLDGDGGAFLVLALAARAQLVHLVLGQVEDRFHHVLAVAVRGLNKWNFHRGHFYFLQKSNSDIRFESLGPRILSHR